MDMVVSMLGLEDVDAVVCIQYHRMVIGDTTKVLDLSEVEQRCAGIGQGHTSTVPKVIEEMREHG